MSRSSNWKYKYDPGKLKSRLGFRDLKNKQIGFQRSEEETVRLLQRVLHWKVDCPRIKDKNNKSKIKTNLTRVINTQYDRTS